MARITVPGLSAWNPPGLITSPPPGSTAPVATRASTPSTLVSAFKDAPQMYLDSMNRRTGEIGTVQGLRGAYSKEAAFADAKGAMDQYLQQALQQGNQDLVRMAEGAGASASSLRALMQQDMTLKAAQGASAIGMKAAADYGNIAANYSNVLEALTRPNDVALQYLMGGMEEQRLRDAQEAQEAESAARVSSIRSGSSGNVSMSSSSSRSGSSSSSSSKSVPSVKQKTRVVTNLGTIASPAASSAGWNTGTPRKVW